MWLSEYLWSAHRVYNTVLEVGNYERSCFVKGIIDQMGNVKWSFNTDFYQGIYLNTLRIQQNI